jgi:hypothetical protein
MTTEQIEALFNAVKEEKQFELEDKICQLRRSAQSQVLAIC